MAALQFLGIAGDAAQRRLEVVRDGVGKTPQLFVLGFELAVADGQLGGARLHALLQVGVQALNFHLTLLALGHVVRQDEEALFHGLYAQIEPAAGAIGEDELCFQARVRALFHGAAQHGEDLGLLQAGVGRQHGRAFEGASRAAVLLYGRVVQVEVFPVEANELAAFEHEVERGLQPGPRGAQLGLGARALGDVNAHADQARPLSSMRWPVK